MTAQSPGRADPSEYSLPLDPIAFPQVRGLAPEGDPIEASSQLRADLLDTIAWSDTLSTYGRTMRTATTTWLIDGPQQRALLASLAFSSHTI